MTSNLFHRIEKCRVCGNPNLVEVLDLGDQYLSGIFPNEVDEEMPRGPLKLVKCDEEHDGGAVEGGEDTLLCNIFYDVKWK